MGAKPASPHPLAKPGVVGLDAGRHAAGKQQRRKRRSQRVWSLVMTALILGAVAGGAYVGYTIYTDQQESDEAERQRRVEERQANRERVDTDELIDVLVEAPRWNGPGAPEFGVGEGEADVPSVVLVEP